ncbi:hypothetical protein [Collinsella sp. An268]|uniref:hypothetical protein n=1 Tax=Collinsella sp. An268 TaxID=1965612 RepID=UPI000B367FD3|nr:hypothetical protein [Collinsella sp. An268]OUO65390.1 hypothetical protein B5F70_01725 [Collinsella sp. An268]
MADADDFIARLNSTPLSKLKVGNITFRRKLINLGAKTLPDAFMLSPQVIISELTEREENVLDDLERQYQQNPEAFAKRLLKDTEEKKEPVADAYGKVREIGQESTPHRIVDKANADLKSARHKDKPTSLEHMRLRSSSRRGKTYTSFFVNEDISKALATYEQEARRAFEDLSVQYQTYLTFQAFSDMPIDLDDLSTDFKKLISGNTSSAQSYKELLNFIEDVVPDAFLVFVAYNVNACFDGDNLWDNFFSMLGIKDGNRQSLFKRAYVRLLDKKSMPCFKERGESFRYFYSALINGGLSKSIWHELWEDVVLPLVTRSRITSGAGLISMLKTEPSLKMGKVLGKIFDNVPATILEPLLNSAVDTATQLDTVSAAEGFTAISNESLPEDALSALSDVCDKKRAEVAGSSANVQTRKQLHVNGAISEGAHEAGLFAFPKAILLFDMSVGKLVVHIKGCKVPDQLRGCRVTYLVNSAKVRSEPVWAEVGGYVLRPVALDVEFAPRYEVEMLVERQVLRPQEKGSSADRNETFKQIAQVTQSIKRLHPGCWEFVRMSDGSYPQKKRGSVSRQRRMAILPDAGLKLVPGEGADIEQTADCELSSGVHATLYSCTVGPGAFFELQDASGEVVAAWSEGLAVSIEKDHAIGVTGDGEDVYSMDSNGGCLCGLPKIIFESAQSGIFNQLLITRTFAGSTRDLSEYLAVQDGNHASVDLSKVPYSTMHGGIQTVESRLRANGKLVMRYRFVVIPISSPIIVSVRHDAGSFVARYSFRALAQCRVLMDLEDEARWDNGRGNVMLRKGAKLVFSCLLGRDSVSMKVFEFGGQSFSEISCELSLAGIEIKVPKLLMQSTCKEPLYYPDVLNMAGRQSTVTLTSTDRRHLRSVNILLDGSVWWKIPLVDQTRVDLNLFHDPSCFAVRSYEDLHIADIALGVEYGERCVEDVFYPNKADVVVIARVDEGFGFKSVRAICGDEENYIELDAPAACEFYGEIRRRDTYTESIRKELHFNEGEQRKEVEPQIAKYAQRDRYILTIYPVDDFGLKQTDQFIDIPIQKER